MKATPKNIKKVIDAFEHQVVVPIQTMLPGDQLVLDGTDVSSLKEAMYRFHLELRVWYQEKWVQAQKVEGYQK